MKIYVDAEYHCHAANPDGIYREVEHPFFEGKCPAFIEGYCYDDSDGTVRIYPWKPLNELEVAQREYEKQLLAEYAEALKIVGVTV